MINYNHPADSQVRFNTKPLNKEQSAKVVRIINGRLTGGQKANISAADLALLQNFVHHYENMQHYVTTTEGTWVMPEDQLPKHGKRRGGLFQLKFKVKQEN